MRYLFASVFICIVVIMTSQAMAQPSPLQKILDGSNMGDTKIHRDLILKDQLLKSNRRNLALIQIVPKKSESSMNLEYQATELTDAVILMNGGTQTISDALYGDVLFGVAFSKFSTLDEQKCISDGMSMENLYAVLYDQSYAYATKHGSQKTSEVLKSLINTSFAQHWHNISILRVMNMADEVKYRTAIANYIATMKKEPELKSLIDSDKFDEVFDLLPISMGRLALQVKIDCQK